jgi:hypothetical protein
MKWTKEDIDYLKENYSKNIPIKEISSHLNKSLTSIKHKAARLLLSRPNVPINKPKNKNHRNIVDKAYYDKYKKQIYERKKRRWQERKIMLVNLIGGKCQRCGYSKCINALEFHHTSEDKEDHITKIIRNSSEQKVLKELEKCILLCANCHRELHYNKGS